MCIRCKRKEIIIPEEYDILPEQSRIILEECRKTQKECDKVKKSKGKSSTGVEDKKRPPSPSSCSLTLDEEIEALKNETAWLDQLQVLHHMDVKSLLSKLDEFRLHCASDGKERHESLSDAKQHFNNWLRIVAGKKQNEGVTIRTGQRNRRKGNILRPDEKKTYGGTF